MSGLVADAKRAGANALFIQVRRRANSFYIKSLEPPVRETGYSPDFDALADTIAKAHAAGIEVHAWFAVCPVGGSTEAASDPRHIVNLHGPTQPGRENWMSVTNTGQTLVSNNYWIDPGHPDAAAYTADVIQHVVQNYAVDGIHLDLLRYSEDTTSTKGWGYNPVAVERFNRLSARAGEPPVSDADWAEFRRQQVTALVRKIYLRAVRFRRDIRVSAALIPWGDAPASMAAWPGSAAYSRVWQDWANWLKEGILDFGVPMNYSREHDATQKRWFDNWLAFERANQGSRIIVTGIAAYLNSIPNTLEQVRRVLTTPGGGTALGGTVFYSYAVTNATVGSDPVKPNSEFYAAAGDFFTARGFAPPDMPWKSAPARGHVFGEILVDGEARSPLADGVRMVAQGPGGTLTATVDGTGAFGYLELQPGSYSVRGLRGNTVVLPAREVMVRAGEVTAVSISASRAAFSAAVAAPNQGGVTNAASFAAGVLAPGSLVSIFGTGLAEATGSATALPLPPVLAGAQVLVNGAIAPLLYVSPLQINAQAPFGLQGGEASVVIRRNGLESAAVRVPLVEAAPGLFAPVLKADYSLVSAANPASRGGIILLYGTGLGAVTPAVSAGVAAPVAATVAAPAVSIGGWPARVLYSGLAPGYAGLYQINVEIPADAPAADSVAVQITVAGRAGNSITVAIR